MSGAGSGLFGTNNGSFFKAPHWVDLEKRPGRTTQKSPKWIDWVKSVFMLKHILLSPNLIWLSFAILVYLFFPYDLEAAKEWQVGWVMHRALLNIAILFIYYGFWFGTLRANGLGWGKRKFNVQDITSTSVVFHNVYYSFLGTLQWTAWECGFMHLYATGKLAYVSDAELFSTPSNAARTLIFTAAVPVWRGLHFYASHRFIHMRAIYRYVHCLHHRNVDIEPFSGLCMYVFKMNHLYYFSCLAPSLCVLGSPFHMLWNGMHLLLSPAASHSGYEDHSDQFHYLHHRYFECNFGSASFPLDNLFGTFRSVVGIKSNVENKIEPNPEENPNPKEKELINEKGNITEKYASKKEKPSRSLTLKIPSGFYVYFMLTSVGLPLLLIDSFNNTIFMKSFGLSDFCLPHLIGSIVAFGPLVLAAILVVLTGDKLSWRWPFHREVIIGKFGMHLIVGFLVGVLPVFHIISLLLSSKTKQHGYGNSSDNSWVLSKTFLPVTTSTFECMAIPLFERFRQ
eukprot:GSMAST32.ASY1.ANO1.31.1 assembled CDS